MLLLPQSNTFRRARARGGRSLIAPWLLATLSILLSFTAVRMFQRSKPGGLRMGSGSSVASTGAPVWDGDVAQSEATALAGSVELADGGRLEALVVPYHRLGELEAFRSARLRDRYDLAEGELLRVLLVRDPPAVAADGDAEATLSLTVLELELRDATGGAAVDLARADPPRADASIDDDPLWVLLTSSGGALAAGAERQFTLWGRAVQGEARLIVRTAEGEYDLALEGRTLSPHEVPRWFRRATAMAEEPDERDERIASLEADVEELRDALRLQKLEHVRFVQGLERLAPPEKQAAPAKAEVEATPEPEPDPAVARASELGDALRALFKVSGFYGLDLLNAGALIEGGIGPVLFRTLDDRGRTTGSLAAERLRIEASRSARTLTIVLEDGFESHDGERLPFDLGERRISIRIDPEDWITRAPELFSETDRDPPEDDGIWDHGAVRAELNRLLGADTSAGWFRVHSFGAISGTEFLDAHVEEFDAAGHIWRRLFADRMRVDLSSSAVSLRLTGGATLRGDVRESFRDGRHDILLPRADRDAWRGAALPGVRTSRDADSGDG